MSLINEMLKDLEKRPKPSISPEDLFQGTSTTLTSAFKHKKKYYFIITLLLLVFIALIGTIMIKKNQADIITIPQTTNNLSSATMKANQDRLQKDVIELPPGIAMLTGVALQMQDNTSALRLLLSQNALYHVNSDVLHHTLIIIFERTHLLAALPKMNYAGSGIENIQAFSDEHDNLKLVLQLSPGADIKRLELNNNSKAPELQLDLLYQGDLDGAAEKTETIPVTIKNPIVENTIDDDYQKALQFSTTGQISDAIQLLNKIVALSPSYHQGQELLIQLLLQQHKLSEASTVVNVALNRQPDDAVFTELKARIWVEEGKINEAVKLLESAAPSLEDNPGYHAFIAALYQRQGRISLAADLYKQLLTLQPQNSKYWLGLGIAFDAMGNHSQAVEAYTNAQTSGGLNPELQAYVDTQLRST